MHQILAGDAKYQSWSVSTNRYVVTMVLVPTIFMFED